MPEEGQVAQVPYPPDNQQILKIAELAVPDENPQIVVKTLMCSCFIWFSRIL